MVDLEPERWKVIEAAEKVPLKVKLNYGNMEIIWEIVRIDIDHVAISNFLLPPEHVFVEPSLE